MAFPLVVCRVKRWGESRVVILPKDLRESLQIHEGDIIAIRVKPPYGHFCVWPMNKLVPLGEVPVDELPPLNPVRLGNVRRT